MIPIKVLCHCGQKYSFEVEPVQGRMPSVVACPVCGADGTAAANEIIARSLPTAPLAATPSASSVSAPPPQASTPDQAFSARVARAFKTEGEGEKWKWWYFVLAGICLGGYSIWQAYTQHRIQPLGELFFAVLCVAIGIWDFQHKRKKKRM